METLEHVPIEERNEIHCDEAWQQPEVNPHQQSSLVDVSLRDFACLDALDNIIFYGTVTRSATCAKWPFHCNLPCFPIFPEIFCGRICLTTYSKVEAHGRIYTNVVLL